MKQTCEVRFTRHYHASPEEVWATLTEPESLARWLAPVGEVDLSPGGQFELRLSDVQARVRAVEPERLLELDWVDSGDDSVVRFVLAPEGEGTVLTLDHLRIDATAGMRSLARWQHHLDRFDSLVAHAELLR